MKVFPTLYKAVGKGKIKQWIVTAELNLDGEPCMVKTHGFVDGKQQRVFRKAKAKNVGKKNETSEMEQAELEAASAWRKKFDKGYVEEEHGVTQIKLPMKAQGFKKAKHRIDYPAIVQPKFNGIRFTATKKSEESIDFRSRKNKDYNPIAAHLKDQFLKVMEVGEILDGELYVHGWTFQRILRATKKVREDTLKLEAYLFDFASGGHLNVQERMDVVASKVYHDNSPVRMSDYVVINSEEEVYEWHDKWVKMGFEGVMVRNIMSIYEFNKRTHNLQKYKEFFDKEVKIIGGHPDVDGGVIFDVQDELDNQFKSRPKGTLEDRRRWMDEIDQIIGKDYTIRYQELSEDGVPIFNVGIEIKNMVEGVAIRDYE